MCCFRQRNQSMVGGRSWSCDNSLQSRLHQQRRWKWYVNYIIFSTLCVSGVFMQSSSWPNICNVLNVCTCNRKLRKAVECFLTQRTGQTTSSSAWQTFILSSQHRPCGTTLCVVSIQALYLLQRQSPCIVRTTYRRSDISSCIFPEQMATLTSVSWKSSHRVSDCCYVCCQV